MTAMFLGKEVHGDGGCTGRVGNEWRSRMLSCCPTREALKKQVPFNYVLFVKLVVHAPAQRRIQFSNEHAPHKCQIINIIPDTCSALDRIHSSEYKRDNV